MGVEDSKIRWNQVNRWYQRERIKTNWKPWGLPEVVDSRRSAFADVDPMPQWKILVKVAISATINGAFFSKNVNKAMPLTASEIINSAEECIAAGAQIIHIHVRDENGLNCLDVDRFRSVIEPLRLRHPGVAIDGCLVAVNNEESDAMEVMMKSGLLDAVPINTTAVLLADNMFLKSPHAIIKKAQLALEAGVKPGIAVYCDGDVDNARRFLIDSGLLNPPFFWIILPALPGCSPMYSPQSMISSLTRYVQLIREVSEDSVISVCAAGRASTFLATLAIMMGLHVRVGMEDTIYKWPHRDDRLPSSAFHFMLAKNIAESLGRDVMSAQEYLALIGATTPRVPFNTATQAKKINLMP